MFLTTTKPAAPSRPPINPDVSPVEMPTSPELGVLMTEVHQENEAEQRRRAEELARLRALADRD